MAAEVIVETRNLSKVYRDFWGRQKVRALKALDLEIRRGEVVFDNVSFAYPGSARMVVENINFHLEIQEKIALIGENGAGKTTLVKLLARLYDPTAGQILLDGVDLREYSVEDLRKEIGVIFETATPFDTPRLMRELILWSRTALDERQLHPLLVIAIFTVVFLEIHPFQDGNGRLSRVLTTLLLLRSGYAYVPYSSLESVIEHSKEGYYLALRKTQGTIRTEAPDWQPWVIYFLRTLQQQKLRLEKKIESERILMTALPELSLHILDIAKDRGRVTIGEIVTLTGANRNTVKKHLKALVAANRITQHGTGKGTCYRRA